MGLDAPHTMRDLYPSRGRARPKVLPRHDPVVYSTWTPSAPLARSQTEFYDHNGYLVLEGLFEAEELALLQHRAKRLLADPSELDPETLIAEPESGLTRSIFRVHAQDPLFRRLSGDSRLASVAAFLLGDSIYVHQSRLNYKSGLRGKEFYWHSDFETWHAEDGMPRMRALSMSILLTKNVMTNGPLMVIPESHRSFLACAGETPENHYKQSLRKQDYGTPDDDLLAQLAHDNDIVPLVGEVGTVIIFDCNMMHGSNGNITPWPRSNLFFVYNALSNRLVAPFGAPSPRPEFIAARRDVHRIEPVRGRLVNGRL